MAASGRPIFDFDGALTAAHRLGVFANDYRDTLAPRFNARNDAIGEWHGTHADTFAERADDENQTAINVLLSLRQESSQWLEAWTRAVEIMNNVLYAEAVAAQEKYRKEKAEERNALEQAWDGVDHFFTGSDTVYDLSLIHI